MVKIFRSCAARIPSTSFSSSSGPGPSSGVGFGGTFSGIVFDILFGGVGD